MPIASSIDPLVDIAVERARTVLEDFERASLKQLETDLLCCDFEIEEIDQLLTLARAKSRRTCDNFLEQLKRELSRP
jgi:hypothetical protein